VNSVISCKKIIHPRISSPFAPFVLFMAQRAPIKRNPAGLVFTHHLRAVALRAVKYFQSQSPEPNPQLIRAFSPLPLLPPVKKSTEAKKLAQEKTEETKFFSKSA